MSNNIPSINRADLQKLFSFTTSRTHCLFNGVAMGSSLSPILANLFSSLHEQDWLSQYGHNGPEYYRQYINYTFCLFLSCSFLNNCFEYLNTRHPCITFTMEKEVDRKLPFLDVLVAKQTGTSFETSIYHKMTYMGLLTNCFNFTAFSYRTGLIKTLINRTFKRYVHVYVYVHMYAHVNI